MGHHFSTRAIHAGQTPDPATGAIMTPIYATSTYVQQSPGVHKGYEYARTQNPTRMAYERCVADLESGTRGFAFASGLAAMATVLDVLDTGSHVVAVLGRGLVALILDGERFVGLITRIDLINHLRRKLKH